MRVISWKISIYHHSSLKKSSTEFRIYKLDNQWYTQNCNKHNQKERMVAMNTKEKLINEIERTPELFLSEVLDFLHFLKTKDSREKWDIAMMSESSLAKDWLKPEENEAWKNL